MRSTSVIQYEEENDTLAKTIKDLNVGDEVFFQYGKTKRFIVRNKRENFVIATSKSEKEYTIIDTDKGVCGPDDSLFQFIDYATEEGRHEALHCLTLDSISDDAGNVRMGISRRNGGSVEDILDLVRTFRK